MDFFKHYLVAAGLFILIDALWLRFVANTFYKKQLGSLLLTRPKFGPAVVFYLLYIVGVVVFALNPALGSGSIANALGRGALLGLLMYATYDLTNLSTLKSWPIKLVLVDMIWGTCVTAIVTTLAFLVFH